MTNDQIKSSCKACPNKKTCNLFRCTVAYRMEHCYKLKTEQVQMEIEETKRQIAEYELKMKENAKRIADKQREIEEARIEKIRQEMDDEVKEMLVEFDNPSKRDYCVTCPRRDNCIFQRLRDTGRQASCPYYSRCGQKHLRQAYKDRHKNALIDPTLLETPQRFHLN